MNQKQVLLITGLLRDFPAALDYLEKMRAFSKFQVILSTWETQIEENTESLKIFEKKGGFLITTPAIHIGRFTSVASQHLSLARGLIPEISNSTVVIKTRTDWMVGDNILRDVEKVTLNKRDPKILISGFVPSSPYFLKDGHFVSTAKNLRRIANLDLMDILRYSYIHPEQNFFLPSFGQRSSALEKWLAIEVGTQFERLTTSEWMRIRLKSSLFYFVIGEYLNWIHKETGPIRFHELDASELDIKEFLFGSRSKKSSRRTRLIFRNHVEKDFLEKISFPNESLKDYFWRGFNGDALESEELQVICLELERRIKRSILLNNSRKTVDEHNFKITPQTAKQLESLQNEISWLREQLKSIEGADTI